MYRFKSQGLFFDRKRFLMDREKTGADTMQALLEMI